MAAWTYAAAVALVLAIWAQGQACPLETGLNCPDDATCVSNMMFCPCPAGRGKEATYDTVSREVTGFACTTAAVDTCPDSGYLCPDGATCVNHPKDCPCPASHPVFCWEVVDQIFTCHTAGTTCPDTCDAGEFGTSCQPCPDCGVHGACNEGMQGDGQCTCDTGWTGAACNECAAGYWGILCTECSVECGAHGACDDGKTGGGDCTCDAGWAGAACDECAPGFFGAACTACDACAGSTTCDDGLAGTGECVCGEDEFGLDCETCPDCNAHGTCNAGPAGDGTCACDPGYDTATHCADCTANTFGAACDEACPDCGAHGSCRDGVSGDGTCECNANYDGALCDECDPGHFGAACTPCSSCSAPFVCDDGIAGSGTCVCPAGFTGAACDACLPGHFGAACTPCAACVNGTCVEGIAGECTCETNFAGDMCDACDAGFYSRDCLACPDCGTGTCIDGYASDGQCDCPTGLQGIGCAECAPGYFGAQCTECASCGAHGACRDGTSGDGTCECDEGWTGAACTSCDTGFAGPTCAPVASMSATQSTVTVTSTTGAAGGAVTLLVTANDFSGTRITTGGHLAVLSATVTGGGLDLTPTLTDNSDGTYSVVLSWELAGFFSATVSMEGQGTVGTQQFTITPGAPSIAESSHVSPTSIEADATATITVTLRDTFDNLVTGASSLLSVTVGGDEATIVDAGSGVYTASISWGTLTSPTVVITVDGAQLTSYSLLITRAPAPVVLSAKFADSGLAVLVAFDRATNRGGLTGGVLADCATLFTSGALSSLGTGPVCAWTTDRLLTITTGAGATIELSDALTFKQDVVMNARENSHDVVTSGVIASPDTPPLVEVFVNGPSEMGTCEALVLDASPTQGVQGRPMVFVWELIEGGSNDAGMVSATRVDALNEDGPVLDLSQYSVAAGTYRFRVTATQAFLGLSHVVVHAVLVSNDEVVVTTDIPNNAYTISTADSLVVVPHVHASKCGSSANRALDMTFQWTLTPAVAGFGDTDDAMVRSRFFVAPGELPIGSYTLTLGGSETAAGDLDESAAAVHVVGQPMTIVLLDAGTHQQVQAGTAVLLSAVNSRDPDNPDASAADLKYVWTCVSPPGSETPCHDSATGGTLNVPDYGTVPNYDGLATLGATTLASGAAYEFSLTVSATDGSRAATAWRIVEVVDTAVPSDFSITGPTFVNPGDTVVLEATEGMASYAWTLEDDSIGFNSCSATRCPTLAPAGKTSAVLAVAPSQLSPGVAHTFTVAFTTTGGVAGTASFTVEVNTVPSGGWCDVSPTTGVSMETEYRFTCYEFVDEHGPLTYQFLRTVGEVEVGASAASPTASATFLLYEAASTTSATVNVRVTDTHGASSVYTINNIGVTASTNSAGSQLASAMTRMLDGTAIGAQGDYYAALSSVLAGPAGCVACADNVVIALGDQVDGSEPTVSAAKDNLAAMAGATPVVTSTQAAALAQLLESQVGVLKTEAAAAEGVANVYDADTAENVVRVSHEVFNEVAAAEGDEATHLATARSVFDTLGAFLFVNGRGQACGSPVVEQGVEGTDANGLYTWAQRHCPDHTIETIGPITLPATFDTAIAARRRATEGAIVEVVQVDANPFPNANNKGGEISSALVQIRIERDDDVDVSLSNLAGTDRISFTIATQPGPTDAGQRECLMLSADYAAWEDDKCEVEGDAGAVLAATTTTCVCSKTGTVAVWHTPEEKGTLEKGKDAFLDNIVYIGAGAGGLLLLCLCYKRLFCGKKKEASAGDDIDYSANPMDPPRVQMAHRHSQPPNRQSGVPNPYSRPAGGGGGGSGGSSGASTPTAPYGGSNGHPAVQQYQHPNHINTAGYDVRYQQPGAQPYGQAQNHSPYGRQQHQQQQQQQQPQYHHQQHQQPQHSPYGARADAYGGAATYYNTAVPPPMHVPQRPLPPTPPGRR